MLPHVQEYLTRPRQAGILSTGLTVKRARYHQLGYILQPPLSVCQGFSFSFLLSRFSPPMGTSLIHGDVIRYIEGSVNRCKIVRQFIRPARTVQAGRPECPPMALTCPWKHDGGYARVDAWVEASI